MLWFRVGYVFFPFLPLFCEKEREGDWDEDGCADCGLVWVW
jgi:hypothetical protein